MNRAFIKHNKIPLSVIFIQLLVFPFTGAFLLFRRIVKPTEYLGNSRSMKYCGWILISFAIIPTVLGFMGNIIYRGNIEIYFVMWFLPGLYTLFRASRIEKYIKKYEMANSGIEETAHTHVNIPDDDYIDVVQNINNEYTFNITPETPPQYRVVTCSSCGAKKKIIIGKVDKCDYCDMPL